MFNMIKSYKLIFLHKDIYKYTWSNKGYRSVIDYMLVKKKRDKSVL